MRYLGATTSRVQAVRQCVNIARSKGARGEVKSRSKGRSGIPTCAIEKAKCKDFKTKKTSVCYRAWLDLDDRSGRVIDIKAWATKTRRGKT